MKKTIFFLLVFLVTSVTNAQSLIGKWSSLRPIDEVPAYLILQFEEKDSVGLGLLLEIEQEGIKFKIILNCDGTFDFDKDEEELFLNFIEPTVKGNCNIDLPETLQSLLTDEIRVQMDELKQQLLEEVKKRFVQILPMLKFFEIIDLTDKEFKVTTGKLEMTFTKIVNKED